MKKNIETKTTVTANAKATVNTGVDQFNIITLTDLITACKDVDGKHYADIKPMEYNTRLINAIKANETAKNGLEDADTLYLPNGIMAFPKVKTVTDENAFYNACKDASAWIALAKHTVDLEKVNNRINSIKLTVEYIRAGAYDNSEEIRSEMIENITGTFKALSESELYMVLNRAPKMGSNAVDFEKTALKYRDRAGRLACLLVWSMCQIRGTKDESKQYFIRWTSEDNLISVFSSLTVNALSDGNFATDTRYRSAVDAIKTFFANTGAEWAKTRDIKVNKAIVTRCLTGGYKSDEWMKSGNTKTMLISVDRWIANTIRVVLGETYGFIMTDEEVKTTKGNHADTAF